MSTRTGATTLRSPSAFGGKASEPQCEPPSIDWLVGTWHVTHATLPMWKSKRNVRITYTKLAPETDSSHPRVDDLVEYQAPNKQKVSSVHGVSTSDPKPGVGDGWAFKWRGKGWLMIATSNWEILGYGDEAASPNGGSPESNNAWIVTYFTKTLFTPAGIDIYSRNRALSKGTLDDIKAALSKFEDPSLKKLAGEIFEVPTDDNYQPSNGDQQ